MQESRSRQDARLATATSGTDLTMLALDREEESEEEGDSDHAGDSAFQPPPEAGGSMLGVAGRAARAAQRQANTVLDQQIARASLLLGYLFMDGEGTKACNLEAVRHMRRAAALGDEEAHRTLGWMYNTGQFGERS